MSTSSHNPSPITAAVPVEVRPLMRTDSISRLTLLYHRAYAKQVRLGLRPLAARQDESMTLARVRTGECSLALRDRIIVGAIVLNEHERVQFPPVFTTPGVAHFSMLAVDPVEQGSGVGSLLLRTIEDRAVELGNTRLAMSVAEPDTDLVRYYEKRGFETADTWNWGYTNYRSLIMCKEIGLRPLTPSNKASG